MGSDLTLCASVVRALLVIMNGLFVILGIILIAIGSWGIAVDSNFSFVTKSSIISGAVCAIIAGVFTVVVCATGIIAAIFKIRPLLSFYGGALIGIVVLEIIGSILAFAFSATVVGELMEGSLRAIRLYPGNVNSPRTNSSQRDAKTAVDAVQNILSCCGYNNATDWPSENPDYLTENNGSIPQTGGCETCTVGSEDENCVQFTGTYFNRLLNMSVPYTFTASRIGCVGRLEDNLVLIGSVGGALGLVFGLFEITGIFFAFFLCYSIYRAKREEVV